MSADRDYHAIVGMGPVYNLGAAALNIEDMLEKLPNEPHVIESLRANAAMAARCVEAINRRLASVDAGRR
jgi:hypothetical protein